MLTPVNAVIIAAVAVTTLAVMIAWHVRSRGAWRHYPAGRSVMTLLGIQFVILANAAVSSLVGPYPGKALVYAALYLFLEAAVVGVGLSILMAPRARRQSPKETDQ